jgi:uncharacterized protein (TIGR03437 family)
MTSIRVILTGALILIGTTGSGLTATAQTVPWDTSGNSLLNGTYNFRQVYYQVADQSGNLGQGAALYGNIVFSGKGVYSLSNATLVTYTQGTSSSKAYSASGTYSIAASGYGFLSGLYCPLTAGCPANQLNVLVSNGLVVGSSPDSKLNDVFIGAPAPAPAPTNASFQGAWTLAGYIPSISGSAGASSDVFFQVSPDGKGNLGSVNINGYYGKNAGTQTVQTAANVTYSFTSGTATIAFPAAASPSFFSGNENLYFSPDGNVTFGGSPTFPDLVVGVRNPASGTTLTLSGIYYAAGIQENEHFLPTSGFSDFLTYYGAFNTISGNIVEADRVEDVFNSAPLSNTYSDSYPSSITGSYIDAAVTQYIVGDNGTIRIGAGIGQYLGLSIAVQAPVLSGSGVYLNPTGISNGASFAPFTAGISPGEIVVLFGSGLASSSATAGTLPLPAILNGVQVKVNGTAAPIFYVSSGQMAIIVPYETTGPIAQIQVSNNGALSNVVTQFVHATSVGVFTPTGGLGYGAFEHANGSLITEASPAMPGETIEAFVAGLGTVSPAVTDGFGASTTALTYTTNGFSVFFGYTYGNVTFTGLAPSFAGLYQVNVQIPAGLAAGDQLFELDGPDSTTTQTVIPIGAGSAAAPTSSAAAQRPQMAGRRVVAPL